MTSTPKKTTYNYQMLQAMQTQKIPWKPPP